MTTTTFDPDTWIQGWLPDLHYYPTRPSTYGADPRRPDPGLASEFETQAALKGGWKPKPPAKRQRRRKKR